MPRLAAFGGLALLGTDGPIQGSAGRGRNVALLALLARAGEAGATREKLAVLLWPESDAERARHSFDQAMYTLRRRLGTDAFVTNGLSLSLNADVITCDVVDFAAAFESGDLQRAASLYTGPFLDGFHISDSGAFERWVDAERAELHTQYTTALESAARDAAAAGDLELAVQHWRRLAATEPFSSRVALSLMKALDGAGDQAGALRVAAVHEALVREELDAPPDPSVLAFADALRKPQPRRAPREPGAVPSREPGRSEALIASASEPGASAVAGTTSGSVRHSAARGLAAVALILAIVVSFAMWITRQSVPAVSDRSRVIITAFQNETGEPALDYVGRMASDWIIEGLARTGLVRVTEDGIGGASDAIVSGRIYLSGDSIWLQARIHRTGDGAVLRALDAVGAPAANPGRAIDPLRQRVLGALGTLYDPRIAAFAEGTLRPPAFDAYRAFAEGIDHFSFPRDLAGAAEQFRAAAALDSGYLQPRLWLAWTWLMNGEFARADSITEALRSVRQDMSMLEQAWHDRIAAELDGDSEASFRAAQRMMDIAPQVGGVIALANAALGVNQPAVTVATILDAGIANLGPERQHPSFLLTAAYHALGEYERELEATDEAIEAVGLRWGFLGPGVPALAALGRFDALDRRLDELRHVSTLDNGLPAGISSVQTAITELRTHGFAREADMRLDRLLATDLRADGANGQEAYARRIRLLLLYEMGRWREAHNALTNTPASEQRSLEFRAMKGLLAARLGKSEVARQTMRELESSDEPYLFGEPTFWRARIEAALGNHRKALDLLRQAFAEGQSAPAWYRVEHLRDFDPLRSDPSFQQFVRPKS